MADKSTAWIRFLRLYGPGTSNDNQYDEKIRASGRRNGFRPIEFLHPVETEVLELFGPDATPTSVVLTGTAGDGKSNLCRKIWTRLGGDEKAWSSNEPYFQIGASLGGRRVTVHILRDLTGLPDQDAEGRYASKRLLLESFCNALSDPQSSEVFVVAANDGQLIDPWRRLEQTQSVITAQYAFESLLVEDKKCLEGVRLQLFNLSRVPSAQLFDLAVDALLKHEGWAACTAEDREDAVFFGPKCPIRHNFMLLGQPLLRTRLRALFELCDHNGVHIPIRRILQLLINALLGHPDAKDALLRAEDVKGVVDAGTVSRASLYNNVFGGNLSETRRQSLEVFESFDRFRIGHETSNRIDNILIFGEGDEHLKPYFDGLVRADSFYGADDAYYAAQRAYIEGADESDVTAKRLLDMMVRQRRGLFFKIPKEQESELALWELSVFKYAGEYLERLIGALRAKQRVDREIVSRLARGLNRVFVGMLVNTERELLLATSIASTTARVSQVLEDRVSVARRNQESVEIALEDDKPVLIVTLGPGLRRTLQLNLTRYEFLSRVAEGALPGSFSRECYEDILAFKSSLLSAVQQRRAAEGSDDSRVVSLMLLRLDQTGNPTGEPVEFSHD